MNIAELFDKVTENYREYPHTKIAATFISLQDAMNKILDCGGNNIYQLGYGIKKRSGWRKSKLSVCMCVTFLARYWDMYENPFLDYLSVISDNTRAI